RAALSLKLAQDRSDRLQHGLLSMNYELEQGLLARDSDLVEARNAMVLALAELVCQRDAETGAHLMRLRHYSLCLAQEAAKSAGRACQIDAPFLQMLQCCAPLHDIG